MGSLPSGMDRKMKKNLENITEKKEWEGLILTWLRIETEQEKLRMIPPSLSSPWFKICVLADRGKWSSGEGLWGDIMSSVSGMFYLGRWWAVQGEIV